MYIRLNPQESTLLRDYANEFSRKTGKEYSHHYIMSILKEKYEKDLSKDLKKVMDRKLREVEEEKAKGGEIE